MNAYFLDLNDNYVLSIEAERFNRIHLSKMACNEEVTELIFSPRYSSLFASILDVVLSTGSNIELKSTDYLIECLILDEAKKRYEIKVTTLADGSVLSMPLDRNELDRMLSICSAIVGNQMPYFN